MSMRVLHAFKTYWPDSFGGVERVIHEICEGTAGLGVESTVLSLSRTPTGGEAVPLGAHWRISYRLDLDLASTGMSLAYLGHFRRHARAADIVHYHFPWPFMDLGQLTAPKHVPYLVTYHSDIVRQRRLNRLYAPLRTRFLARAQRIVATSPNYVATSDVLQRFRAKTEVIPIGLAEAPYPEPQVTERLRPLLEAPGPFFLSVGVMRHYKGLDDLLAAAPQVAATIVIAGDGPVRAELQETAARRGVTNVVFLGPVSEAEKMALLAACRAFVFPSSNRAEAYGLALVEAAMSGRPMISCEVGSGTSFVNRHGSTGLVVPPHDPPALAAAMTRLATDPELATSYGRAARRRYEADLSGTRMAESYAALYGRLFHAAQG